MVSDLDHITLGNNGTNSAVGCDDLQQTTANHPALYFFVLAQLLIGLGGSGILILTFPYIDENAPPTKSALYLGIYRHYVSFEREQCIFSTLFRSRYLFQLSHHVCRPNYAVLCPSCVC